MEEGEAAFRGNQLYNWIYRRNASSVADMANLPERFRNRLAARFGIEAVGRSRPTSLRTSEDGTRKYLFGVFGTGLRVESAIIPEGNRLTLCLSTQVGCRRGCRFCQTGRQGFDANLTPGDILNQYLSLPERDAITSVVYMGMGEPLDNLEATLRSLELLTDADGIGMGAGRITLSTVGIHPGLRQFLDAFGVNLALSLHSPFAEERRDLMPVEEAHPAAQSLQLLRSRREDLRRKLSVEYTLFAGVNDTIRHARELARQLAGLRVRVNLIPYHPIDGAAPGDATLRPSGPDSIHAFQEELTSRGLRTFVRRSRGQDISAACGMLSTAGSEKPALEKPATTE